MTDLSQYQVTKLSEDGELTLSRYVRSGQPALIAQGSAQLTAAGVAKLERAYSIRDQLLPAWAACPRALLVLHGQPVLISDDPGAELLTQQVGRPLSIATFLRLAAGAAGALRQLHARGLIHKDIKPANLFADPESGRVWLTGFGNTSRLARERQLPEPPEVIAGTLAYMAPEQTGRMNRSIDSRVDLYSLGVTLYELLTGGLPFTANDPMEWVHCHIARQPAPLRGRGDGEIPAAVCAIVMKLLSKTAEDRYQTACGLERDLIRCLSEWESTSAIEPFVPGANDASEHLRIPETLYGRASEIGVLVSSLEQVVVDGGTHLVLVSGYSGIGKSSVVNELHKVLVPPRGLFATGKFDQYKQGIPYATLAQAFHALNRQVLGKNDREIAVWRERFLQALGGNGQLIVNLVPELELIIGKQPSVSDLSPKDAQARFYQVVRRFLGVFARAEHPLALFLDDLQWLDVATLELLDQLLSDSEVRYLLVVGAYRDNEVGADHPLRETFAKLRRGSTRVREIVLAPLEIEDVTCLCSDAMRVDAATVRQFAALVHEKCGGNPFFVNQFIATLVDEGLLWFDQDRGSWRWELATIRAKGFTDNVVDLMARKLERLPPAVRRALGSFACVGNSAPTHTLSLIYEISETGVHEALQDAVGAGLVLVSSNGYAFLHDRVQEAAYATILEQDRAAEHLRIGTILATHTLPDDLADNIFEIVNHLDRGAILIEGQPARDRVAELNRIAGQRAKSSNAHAAARRYFAAGAALLGSNGWQRNFGLAFELELELADCEFMTADLQVAEERLARLGTRATSLTDRAAVIYVQANLYTAMVDRADRAVEICLEYLRIVGIDWSAHPSAETIQSEYQALLARLAGRSIDELLDLPLAADADVIATIEVLLGLFTPAFNTDRGLVALLLLRMGNLGLEYGNTDATSLGYAFLGMVLGSGFGDYRTGFMFGKLARDLVEQRGLVRYRGRIYHTLGTHVLAWTQPIAAAEASLRRGLLAMQQVGDVTYVSFAHLCLVSLLLGNGESLEAVQREAEDAFAIVQRGKFEIAIDGLVGQLRLVRALRGQLPDPCTLDDGCGLLADYGKLGLTRGWYWIRTMQACFIYGNWRAALVAEQRAAALISYSASFFELAEYHFYAGLTLAACFAEATVDERVALRAALVTHRQLLAGWAENCPENFAYRVALIDAEIARIEAQPLQAMDAYEQAIRLSREQGFAHIEAIALEVAARFYAARGFDTFARAYTQQACSAYLRWGAVGKVRQLEQLRDAIGQRDPERSSPIHAPSTDLDLATVVKTSQAVTAEVGLENLIETLMVIALEHAGAERGLLILPRAGELQIEAEATTEVDAGVSVRLRRSIARHPELPEMILHYVSRTQELVLLDDARAQHAFSSDPYLRERHSRSVVCVPLVKQAELIGILYLENRLTPHVFTNTRIAVLKLLASQAATSLENASLEEENATLAEKQSLLKEVHHRVKNNLQLISSLLNLQSSRIKDPAVAELFADSRNRVRSMALVHENLYRAGNFAKIPMASHLKALCAELTRAYVPAGGPLQLVINVGDVHLDMNRAMACGLIVNELVSNALKHAFPAGRAGRVHIELVPTAAGRQLLRVRDDGVGLPAGLDFGRADSLGLQLVGDLTRQLRGSISVVRDNGTTFAIAFDEATPTVTRH